ncbi:MAG TPA: hypothetical protein VGS41_03880 [Chthonomonadales bacterium]|nr:hypothetical protein [Chthonomonadales bacterium]
MLPALAVGQRKSPFRPTARNRPLPAQGPGSKTRAQALALLRHMLHPTSNYRGVQVTERGDHSSRQRIEGDTRGRIRRDFETPAAWSGDIMLVGPNHYRYYHARTGTLDIAIWPTQWNAHEAAMFNMVINGRVTASVVGSELIAGRNASIVELKAPLREMKYWIDPSTGIQLKNELSTRGMLTSRSYMTSIVVGPAADVSPRDFQLEAPAARVNQLFPRPQYHSLEEARPVLPFTPIMPGFIPPGFSLKGVWVFGRRDNPSTGQKSVLLRYSDELESFSLYEHLLRPSAPPLPRPGPASFRRPIQRWRVSTPDGQRAIVFIGRLPARQALAIYQSLH